MHRSHLFIQLGTVILATVCVARDTAAADPITAGTKVMPRSVNLALRIDRRVTARGDELEWPQTVTKVQGRHVGISDHAKKGWALSDEVLRVDDAIEYYTKKIEASNESGNRSRWLKLRGDAYLDLRNPGLALADFTRAIELRPASISAIRGRIMALDDRREFEREIMDCETLLRLDPASEFARFFKARACSGLGHHREAIRALDAILSLSPQNAKALECRAHTFLFLGDNEKAMVDIDCAIMVEPSSVRYAIRAVIHMANGSHELALADVEQGLSYEPEVDGLKIIRSVLQTKLNKTDSQVNAGPQTSTFERWIRASKLLQEKQFEQALAEVDQIDANDPEWKAAKYFLRAMIHFLSEQRREALADLDKALEIKANDPESLYLRGLCYASVKVYPNALADLDAALEQRPDFADALVARGTIKVEQREYEEALQAFDRAVELAPGRSHLDRASAFQQMHRYAEAINDCTCALEKARGESIDGATKTKIGEGKFWIDVAFVSSSSPEQKRLKQIAHALATRSHCYWAQGDYGHAAADFWECLQIDLKGPPADRPDRQAATP